MIDARDFVDIGGPYFEDLERGVEFDAPAVTLTEGHAAVFAALTGDRLRVPLDHCCSRSLTGREKPLAHPLLAINFAIGQSTWLSQRVKANLFYRGIGLRRAVYLGDTLHTVTRVAGLRQNRLFSGRRATGLVALEMTTRNQYGETVIHGWRCPMIPCRDADARTGAADNLESIGEPLELSALRSFVPLDWSLDATSAWRGPRASDLPIGHRYRIEARDSVTLAPELVRLTLNMAMAHTDETLSYLGERLVYGGHTIALAFAQATRALPNMLTLVAWESCDHTAPVLENDRLRSELEVLAVEPLHRGALVGLRIESWAGRGHPESEEKVLDWKLWVYSA